MKRLIFRVSHGKALTSFFDINEQIYDYYGNAQETTLYFVLFPHGMKKMRDRLERVCASFNGEKFEVPPSREDISYSLRKARESLEEVYNALHFSMEQFRNYLVSVNQDEKL